MATLKTLLGNSLTKWFRLKAATGTVTDQDMLLKLIDFFAEAKGISLTVPVQPRPLSPLPLPSSDSRRVTVRVRPMKDAVTPSSFIVIHQTDLEPPDMDDAFPKTEPESSEELSTDAYNVDSFPMVLFRDDEDEDAVVGKADPDQEEEEEEEEGEDQGGLAVVPQSAPADLNVTFEMQPRERTVYLRGRESPLTRRRRYMPFIQDEWCRKLDGMVWREAVLRGRQMPPADVRLMFREPGEREVPVRPTDIPWDDPPPVQEFASEAPILAQIGCVLCPQLGFASRVDLVSHFWLRHPETRERYPTQYVGSKRLPDFAHCSLCHLVGSVAPSFKHHQLVPHAASAHAACQRASERAPHVCDFCHAEFDTEMERDDHAAAAHVGLVPPRHTCHTCGTGVDGDQAYIRHLRLHYTEFVYSCNMCPNFRSRGPETMATHTEAHERRVLRCGLCTFRTRTFRTVADHLRVHLQLPLHVCPVCGYRAFSSSRYFNHMDTHGGRRHRCEVCSQEFTSLLKKSHHKTVTHRRPAEFTCDRCGVVFISRFRLRRHQLQHTGHKPFACAVCGKGLSSRQSLRNHSRICPEGDDSLQQGTIVEVLTS